MAKLMQMLQPQQTDYVDRRFDGTKDEYFEQLSKSATLYIGNLSFYTTEDQLYALFSQVGPVARVIMGLDRNTKTPCGFCFVIYHMRSAALAAVAHLNGTKLDGRMLRVDIDYGFEDGRQFGRGRSGGQVRDEFRTDYDAERGGYGHVIAKQLAAAQLALLQGVQGGAAFGGGGAPPGSSGGAVFFGGAQRRPGGRGTRPGSQQPGAGGGDEPMAADNPRQRGRGGGGDDEDDEFEARMQQHKRRRLNAADPGGAAEPPPAAAAPPSAANAMVPPEGEEEEEQQQQQQLEDDQQVEEDQDA